MRSHFLWIIVASAALHVQHAACSQPTATEVAGASIVLASALGGSVPMYLFKGNSATPVVGVPLANFDNNQHAANENLRLQNLWDAIETFAGLFVLHGQARPDQAALRLAPCKRAGISPPAKCGTFTVWENRDTKAGRTIDLNVVLLEATSPDRKHDPFVFLAGGPGEAATSMAAELNASEVRKQRDVLLVDARGTGRSNGLYCQPGKTAPLQAFMPLMDIPKARACPRELAKRADLRYYLTNYAMDDLDDLRAALGYEKINIEAGM